MEGSTCIVGNLLLDRPSTARRRKRKDVSEGGILSEETWECPFEISHRHRLGVVTPTMRQKRSKIYRLSKPPSVFQHRATTRVLMHSAVLELTNVTYIGLEDNLIRHRGDRRSNPNCNLKPNPNPYPNPKPNHYVKLTCSCVTTIVYTGPQQTLLYAVGGTLVFPH